MREQEARKGRRTPSILKCGGGEGRIVCPIDPKRDGILCTECYGAESVIPCSRAFACLSPLEVVGVKVPISCYLSN